MADLIRFVDSIAASPTLRLDLNDESSWWVKSFSAPPPRLRRSVAENAMRDGINVGSSSYGSRTLTIELECRKSTQDLAATEIQKLWRELDRATNFLMYQPTGATKPVFFRTYRSDPSQLADVMSQQAMRTVTIELLAEPFALGLEESFSGTFSWDGASASGFQASSVPTILGDVAAPLRLDLTLTNLPAGAYLVSQATPSALSAPGMLRAATNATMGTVSTDTSATTGLSNVYWNTDAHTISFATNTALADRLAGIQPPATIRAGSYRLIAHVVDASATAAAYSLRARRSNSAGASPDGTGFDTGETISLELDTPSGAALADAFVDLGVFRVPFGADVAKQADGFTVSGSYWAIQAGRTAGSGSLRIDGLLWVPTIMDDATANTSALIDPGTTATTTTPVTLRLDAEREIAILYTGSLALSDLTIPTTLAGALPSVHPAHDNKLWLIPTAGVNPGGTATTTTIAYSASYKPRYLFVRPVST